MTDITLLLDSAEEHLRAAEQTLEEAWAKNKELNDRQDRFVSRIEDCNRNLRNYWGWVCGTLLKTIGSFPHDKDRTIQIGDAELLVPRGFGKMEHTVTYKGETVSEDKLLKNIPAKVLITALGGKIPQSSSHLAERATDLKEVLESLLGQLP